MLYFRRKVFATRQAAMPSSRRVCLPSETLVPRSPKGEDGKSRTRRDANMDIGTFMAVISYTATIFGLGYMLGQNHANKQK